MKLVEEIIELLGSGQTNLTEALFKTKILLHKLGEKELLEWVDGELKGYPNSDSLPDYRILKVTLRGNVSNGAYRHTAQILPTMHLDDKYKSRLKFTHLTQSIAVIVELSKQEKLQTVIPPEMYHLLSQGIGNGYDIENAWGEPSAGAMTQIITEVTSRLLDFVLALSEQFPEELEAAEMKERSKEVGVSDLFNNTVIGDNATIVVGDSNVQKITNSVTKNDLTSLQQVLRDNRVSEEDIDLLSKAIEDDDGTHVCEGSFGASVSQWMGNMVSKAATTAWDIKVGAAGSLLATAIGKFYGF